MAIFAAHGEYSIRRCGRVVRVDAWGPWNLERTIDYAQRLKSCMDEMPKPFGMLMVSHLQPILGPEGEAVLSENVRTRVLMGCAAQATVLLDPQTVSVAEAQYRRVYVPAGLRYSIFYEIAPAAQWLIENGFSDIKGLQRREEPSKGRRLSGAG